MERDEIIAAAQELIRNNKVFVLATVGEDGGPRMRWMGDLVLDEPLTITMACGAKSRKMDQVRANPAAQLMFQTADYATVVTLFGTCEILTDAATKQRVWDALPSLKDYSSGPDDPGLGILCFKTQRVELLGLQTHGMAPLAVEL